MGKDDGARLFSVAPRNRMGGNGYTLKYIKKNKHFTVRLAKHRNRLCREVVQFPPLKVLKIHLAMALSNMF